MNRESKIVPADKQGYSDAGHQMPSCSESALFDADLRLSRFNAPSVARERLREGFLRLPARPLLRSRLACRFVRALPRLGGGNLTPALLALESPMAIACSGDRAPWVVMAVLITFLNGFLPRSIAK